MALNTKPAITETQRRAMMVTIAILETIVASGPNGIPSGHLYAESLNTFESLDAYESCLSVLLRAGLIKRCNHVLTATIPE